MKFMYVYILECADDSLYIGVTNNVGRRFIEHCTGLHEESYTFDRRPLKLVYCKQFNKPIEAIKFEKQIKRWTRAKKNALVLRDFNSLHELAKCMNQSTHTRLNGSGFGCAHPDPTEK